MGMRLENLWWWGANSRGSTGRGERDEWTERMDVRRLDDLLLAVCSSTMKHKDIMDLDEFFF